MTKKSIGLAAVASIFVITATCPSYAAVTEAQARAKCAKAAQQNASPQNQQRYADACVAKAMANQKK